MDFGFHLTQPKKFNSTFKPGLYWNWVKSIVWLCKIPQKVNFLDRDGTWTCIRDSNAAVMLLARPRLQFVYSKKKKSPSRPFGTGRNLGRERAQGLDYNLTTVQLNSLGTLYQTKYFNTWAHDTFFYGWRTFFLHGYFGSSHWIRKVAK